MIRGHVNSQLEALVSLQIRGRDGRFQPVPVIVDTGFDGFLTLPPEVIRSLGLAFRERGDVILAGGIQEQWNTWTGQVLWHDKLRTIQVLEAEGTPLLGMSLLRDSRLTVEVRAGGDVLIEELGGIEF